jgi:DNA end-binding protein Ku
VPAVEGHDRARCDPRASHDQPPAERAAARRTGTRIASRAVMAARSIDTATLTFGLVTIPVQIYSTSQHSEEIHFHMIHAGCGERLKQQYMCPTHGIVERADMSKGYAPSKGRMIELEPAELKALDAVGSDEIELAEFVPAEAVDPIYVDRTYYLAPGKGGDRAYHLFREALVDANLVGIARFAARGKQYVVEVRPFEKDGLVMHQLRYPDEVKPWSEIDIAKAPKTSASELKLALQVIEALRKDELDLTAYRDDVKDRVRDLIAQKVKSGEEIVAPEHEARPHVPDLMAALKASLEGGEPRSEKSATHTNGKKDGKHRKRARTGRRQVHHPRASRAGDRGRRSHAAGRR